MDTKSNEGAINIFLFYFPELKKIRSSILNPLSIY